MKSMGVDSRPFFYPLSTMPMYESTVGKVAADLSARGLNLPTYPELTEAEIDRVCDALTAAVQAL
jgi:perosamine synthetase